MGSIAERLRQLVDERGGVAWFANELRSRGIRGSSRPMIYRYLNQSEPTTPPLELIVAAAEIFDVLPSWLAFGTGAKTVAELRVQTALGPRWAEMEEMFYGRVPEWLQGEILEAAAPVVVPMFIETLEAWYQATSLWGRAEGLPELTLEEVADDVSRALYGPLLLWPIRDQRFAFMHYGVAMLHALQLAAPYSLPELDAGESGGGPMPWPEGLPPVRIGPSRPTH